MDASIEKVCTKCLKTKLFKWFKRDKSHKTGYSSQCKHCISLAIKKRRPLMYEKTTRAKASALTRKSNRVAKYGIDLIDAMDNPYNHVMAKDVSEFFIGSYL